MENPFTITFGKQPNKYISRYEDTDKIISTFSAENPVAQSFLIAGIRGSGKTVLMTAVANILERNKDWIVINLNPTMDLLESFAIRLNEASGTKIEIKGFNISAAGFGMGVDTDKKPADYVGVIDRCIKNLIKKKKRILITVDEVMCDQNMKVFASQFQIFLRQDYPVFLIMTGLYENIYEIQNDPALTFLLRSPKILTDPLSILQITRQYKEIFALSEEKANELANMTRGYAFAFQALGVSYWENRDKGEDAVLYEYDGLLDDFVYKKIWSSLSGKEREIIRAVSENEVKTSTICEKLSMNSGTFSRYREKLKLKGVIETSKHGFIGLSLPRFYEVTKNYKI